MSLNKSFPFNFITSPSLPDDFVGYAKFLTQHLYGNRFTSEDDGAVSTFIIGLLESIRPSAIIGSIISIVVGPSVDGHVCRARSHVTEKSFKAILPFRVHRNTATAIIRPGFDVRIKAAFFDFAPCSIFPRLPHAMFTVQIPTMFSSEAATTLGIAIMKLGDYYRLCVAAITLAKPSTLNSLMMGKSKSNKSAKSLPSDICGKSHELLLSQGNEEWNQCALANGR